MASRNYAPPSPSNIKCLMTARSMNVAQRKYVATGSNVWNFEALLYRTVAVNHR